MKRLNLLYLVRTWALGGSHTIVRLLLKHLPRDQFKITTVAYDAPGQGDSDFIASVRRQGDDVAPERIPWRSRGNWFRARNTIADLIAKYKIDIAHAHDTHSNVLLGLGRKRWPCAIVASPYGWWQPRWHVQAHAYHWVEKHLALPNFDAVYTVSQDMKQKILAGPTQEARIHVIHTGLDLAALESGATREQTRSQLGIASDAVVIGTVSRLSTEKGHCYLLEAAAQLVTEFPELRLLIVGAGAERMALEERTAKLGLSRHVIFTGFYDDVSGALRAMDVFAQPSILDEGFPTSVLEAQAMGLPVVASDIGGTKETMQAGVTGTLVPPRDETALAAAVRVLLESPAMRTTQGAAARAWIVRGFTLEKMLTKIAMMYQGIAQR